MKATDAPTFRHTSSRWYRWYPAPENAIWVLRLPEWFAWITTFLALCMFGQGSHRLAAAYGAVSAVAWVLRFQAYAFVAGFEEYRQRARAEIAQPMTAAELAETVDPLPVIDGQGYLYVIRFSSGVVKVGQTVEPRRRLVEHRRDSEAYDVSITHLWVSQPHSTYLVAEAALIEQCTMLWMRARREYFYAADFDVAVGIAKGLTLVEAQPAPAVS